MTDDQQKLLKSMVIAELEKAEKDIATPYEVTKPQTTEDIDEVTLMDVVVNKSVNNAAFAAARNRQAALEYALKRVETEYFGHCIECGEEIPMPRLLAMPQTLYCLDCAQ